ncbi:hypothetical protein [Streptomyces ipomoeae]|uniref:hypothetical protein n=1 Tax=Streptomyces ipomoeae TaxID=103232 RepID=UPI001147473E|nr:hypothetical protein [Streptomyces ipomoeae]MDX2935658.1 hypothetical protein [Streptomyces ipomoeae]TQE15486.1 hypothetical protein SipoB123_43560 [Streptomyces ipomoeae]
MLGDARLAAPLRTALADRLRTAIGGRGAFRRLKFRRLKFRRLKFRRLKDVLARRCAAPPGRSRLPVAPTTASEDVNEPGSFILMKSPDGTLRSGADH